MPEIVEALNALALLFGPAQRGQQQGRKERDDGNDRQEFDQGEGWIHRVGSWTWTRIRFHGLDSGFECSTLIRDVSGEKGTRETKVFCRRWESGERRRETSR